MGHLCLFEGKNPVTLQEQRNTEMCLRIGASVRVPLGYFSVLLQCFQVTLESQLQLPLVKYNAKEQTTEEMIKGFKATSLSEPSETSTGFAQPVKAELSTYFFLKVS